jgi:hypothetical protein
MVTQSALNWRKILQLGLIGGLVCLLITLVGMLEEFSGRDIVAGVITMGQTLLVLTLTITGFGAARASGARGAQNLLAGAAAGVIAGGILALLAVAVENLNLRPILVNASPALVKILTFGKDFALGLGLLMLAGAIIGLFGGFISWLPERASSGCSAEASITVSHRSARWSSSSWRRAQITCGSGTRMRSRTVSRRCLPAASGL